MKYYTVETRAVSIDPNRNYTAMERCLSYTSSVRTGNDT